MVFGLIPTAALFQTVSILALSLAVYFLYQALSEAGGSWQLSTALPCLFLFHLRPWFFNESKFSLPSFLFVRNDLLFRMESLYSKSSEKVFLAIAFAALYLSVCFHEAALLLVFAGIRRVFF